jgi:hypothetical protein
MAGGDDVIDEQYPLVLHGARARSECSVQVLETLSLRETNLSPCRLDSQEGGVGDKIMR